MNFGLLFETVLGATLVYASPLNTVFGTMPLHILHWFPAVPWSMFIFTYDEIRKALMRGNPDGGTHTLTGRTDWEMKEKCIKTGINSTAEEKKKLIAK